MGYGFGPEYVGRAEEKPMTDREAMDAYQEHTKKQVRELSSEQFSSDFHRELDFYGLDADSLNERIYAERNAAIQIVNGFKKGKIGNVSLKNLEIENLLKGISNLEQNLERVKKTNEAYVELTEKPSVFYEQCSKLVTLAQGILAGVIESKKINGDSM